MYSLLLLREVFYRCSRIYFFSLYGSFQVHTKVEIAYDELSFTHHSASTISRPPVRVLTSDITQWFPITATTWTLQLVMASQVRRLRGTETFSHAAKMSTGPELRGKLWVISVGAPKMFKTKGQQNWALSKFYGMYSRQSNNRFHEDLWGRIFNAEFGCLHEIVC